MSFPSSPYNGQTVTVNGVVYNWNSTSQTWTRVGGTLSNIQSTITTVIADSFETLSRNIRSYPYIINYITDYRGTIVSNITYTPSASNTITKAFSYPYDSTQIQSIAIYGTTLANVFYKNLTYSNSSVSSVSYTTI